MQEGQDQATQGLAEGGTWLPPGTGGTWLPPGSGGYAQAPPPRRRGRAVLALLAVAVVAAAAGAGTVIGLRSGSPGAGLSGVSSQQIPVPDSHAPAGTGTAAFNAHNVAAQVTPGLVDINSALAYQSVQGAGTGLILSASGLVLTNNHVVQGAGRLTATQVSTGHTYQTRVIGVDPSDDVALIQLVGASGLTPVHVGDSAKVTLGTPIAVIGNAGGAGGTPTVTTGTITALHRNITASEGGSGASSERLHNMLQTNAPVAEGDSGGAWANSAGQVIGMTTAANSQSLGGPGTSMGFAVPIDRALAIARQIAAGHASSKIIVGSSPFLGVGVADAGSTIGCQQGPGLGPQAPVSSGAAICQVFPGTPAAHAGLTASDVITAVNGQQVTSASSLGTVLGKYRPGTTVSLTWVDATGQRHTSRVSLTQGPPK